MIEGCWTLYFGVCIPNFGSCCGSSRALAELAREAEDCGWDGFFIFDHILYSVNEPVPLVDSWVALAAIAMNTSRVRIGPLVTPIARRRPWKLAREATSIDHLSNGRLTLGVGLGDPSEADFAPFGEDPNDKVRAEKLDEGLGVIVGLWRGQPFTYSGKHYEVNSVQFLPKPLQSPRIPLWVAGRWPRNQPFLRAAQWDGVFPLGLERGSRLVPKEIRSVSAFIQKHRHNPSPYDIVATSGASGEVDNAEILSEYVEAGATWWLEDLRRWRDSESALRERIAAGPPGTP